MRDFADTPITAEELSFQAGDGRALSGRIFTGERVLAVMAVFPATGYRKEFYEAFARAAARQGWAVLTFDYRGQGDSRVEPARSDPATMLDWGRLDMPAAAREICRRHPGLPLDIVGHSIGGHFLALLPDALPLRRVALLSSSSGYWGRQSRSIKYTAWAFWRVVGPAFLATKGYVPKGVMWKGEDLPPGVWKDWRDWGVRPDYFRDRLAEEGLLAAYERFSRPIKAWVADDDPIANPGATRWLLEQYENAPSEMKIVRRADLGRGAIGHHGLFHPAMADVFWPQVWAWLASEQGARQAA